MKKTLTLFFLMALVCLKGWGQTTITQNFDASTFPPTGWTNNTTWSRLTNSALPEANGYTVTSRTAGSGTGYAAFDSYNQTSGTKGNLITPSFDLSARGTNTPTVSFWLYRSHTNFQTTYKDSVIVYINTSASLTGATILGGIPRDNTVSPTATNDAWSQYTFNIPSAFNTTTNYLIFVGKSDYGYDVAIDDITYQTYPTSITTGSISGSPFCVTPTVGSSVSVPFTSTGTYTSNTYTAQLSNASGSFSSPTSIGTLVSNANTGTIPATIPAGTVAGTGYRIRVVSSNPLLTGSDNGSNLTINGPPTTSNAGSNQTVCGTSAVALNANTPTSGTGMWSVTSGPSTLASQFSNVNSPTATFTPAGGAGAYVLTWTITSSPCTPSSLSSVTITVNQKPTAIASSNTPVCVGSAIILTGTTNIGTSYSWTGPNSFTSNVQSPTISSATSATAGSYVFTATANGCSNTGSTSVVVNTAPTITSSGQPSNQTTCGGTAKTFTVTATGTSPTYQWQYSADGSTNWANVASNTPRGITYANSASATLAVTPSTSAAVSIYYYRCIVSVNGCATPATSNAASLTVNQTATVTAYTPNTGQAGTSVAITGTNLIGASNIFFNGVAAASFTVNSSTSITAVAPSGVTTGNITFTDLCGNTVTVGNFTVIPTITSFTPSGGCPNVATVVITGTNFTGATAVTIGGTSVSSFTVNSATKITATVGSGTSGTIAVTNTAGTATSVSTFTVNPGAPTVAGTITGTATQCPGLTNQTYNISSIPNATNYAWTVPTGWTIASGQGSTSINVTTGSAGQNGYISVVPSNSCGSSNGVSQVININPVNVTNGTGYTSNNGANKTTGDINVSSGGNGSTQSTGFLKFDLSGLAGATSVTGATLTLTNNGSNSSNATNNTVPLGTIDPTTASASTINNIINNSNYYYSAGAWAATGSISLNLNTGNKSAYTDILSQITTPGYLAIGLLRGGTNVYTFYGYNGGTSAPQLAVTYVGPKNLAVSVTPASVAGIISGGATVCAGTNSTALTLSGNTGTIQWQSSTDNSTFTNISGATGQTYTATNLSTTTYYRSVVTNGNCSSATSASVTITVNQLPTATIAANANQACLNGSQPVITFTGSNGTPPYTFTYKISGDASTHTVTGSGTSVTATISVPTASIGNYTYTLTSVKDASSTTCSNTIISNNTSVVTVYALPQTFNLTSGSFTVCSDGSNAPDFSLDGSESGVTYQLLRNGSVIATIAGTGNAVDFGQQSVAGTYTATATNSNSCSVNMGGSATVTVAAPILTYNVLGSGTFCGQTIVTLSGSQTGVTYHLIGGTSSTQTGTGDALSFPVSSSGSYSMYGTAGACNNSMSGTASITINPLPIITLLSDAVSNLSCVNNNVTYTTDAGQTGYIWSISGTSNIDYAIISGGTAGSNTITVKWLTPGTKTVSVNYSNSNGCTATTAKSSNITVNPIPTDNLQIAAAPAAICLGSSTSIVISQGTPGNTVYYTIDNGSQQNVQIGSGGNATINTPAYNTPGTSTYTLIGESNASGCSVPVSGSVTVTINSLPIVYPISGNSYVAVGGTVNLSELTKNGTWSVDNTNYATLNSTTANPVTASGMAVGTANIKYRTLTDANGCADSTSLAVKVYDPTIAGYRTKAAGNFSDPSVWEVNAGGTNWDVASTAPGSDNSIEVRHNLVLDQDYSGSATSNFSITNFNGADGTFTIAPNHYFSSLGNVDFNNKPVTVKSTILGTGAIGYMAKAILGATAVTAERYIPVKPDATITRAGRSWRLLTSPVKGTTVNAAWQEGKLWDGTGTVASTGYGTLITGQQQGSAANANSHGYDYWDFIQNAYSSIRYYSIEDKAASGTWSPLPGNGLKDANNNFLAIDSYPAYLLFVRGDRSQNSPPASGATTLRPTGTLNQLDTTIMVSGTKALTVVGNPFASVIDFEQIYNRSHNIKSQYWRWNANNNVYGGYDLIQRNGGSYTVIPSPLTSQGTQEARYIESGQGFLVEPMDSTGGSLVIGEGAKANAPKQGSIFRENSYLDKKLFVNLNLLNPDSSTTLADGLLVRYDKSYSGNLNGDDVEKTYNMYENISIGSHSSDLIVEARPNIQTTDTIQLKLWSTTQRSYQLQTKTDHFDSTIGLRAWLEDNYLHTKTEINLHSAITTVNFSVTADAASQLANRFRIVFKNDATLLRVTLTSVKAVPQNGGVNVSWTVANELNIKGYTVERSTDNGRTFTAIATVDAKNLPNSIVSNYNSFDPNPQKGDNLYRIRMESKMGAVTYSSIVNVTIGEDKQKLEITFYPNPVRDGIINLQLHNMAQGTYLVSVYSNGGQTVYQKTIAIAQSSIVESEQLRLGNGLAAGSYNLHITDGKGATLFTDKFIVAK